MYNKRTLNQLKKEYNDNKKALENIKTIKNRVENNILNNRTFLEEDTGKRIINNKRDWLMCEDDFINYCKLSYKEFLKLGVAGENYEIDITYKFEKQLDNTIDKLVAYGLDIMPNTHAADREYLRENASNNYKLKIDILNLVLKLGA